MLSKHTLNFVLDTMLRLSHATALVENTLTCMFLIMVV